MTARYRVSFDRIGRNHNVAPLEVEAITSDHLARQIFTYARPHLRSSDVDVLINPDGTGGHIACGFQTGGRFTIEVVEAVSAR